MADRVREHAAAGATASVARRMTAALVVSDLVGEGEVADRTVPHDHAEAKRRIRVAEHVGDAAVVRVVAGQQCDEIGTDRIALRVDRVELAVARAPQIRKHRRARIARVGLGHAEPHRSHHDGDSAGEVDVVRDRDRRLGDRANRRLSARLDLGFGGPLDEHIESRAVVAGPGEAADAFGIDAVGRNDAAETSRQVTVALEDPHHAIAERHRLNRSPVAAIDREHGSD